MLRTRERGVPRYNEFRRLFHLDPVSSFEELTDNPAWAEQLRELYGDIERVDLMVGLYAEPKPQGFGFSDTAFRVFILMASRRLESDRFFTRDYRPRGVHAGRLRLGRDRTPCARCCCAISRSWRRRSRVSPTRSRRGRRWPRRRRRRRRGSGAGQRPARRWAAIRLLNGGLALLAPRFLARRLGAPPEAVPSLVYPLRMFGVRTVLLGADLWRHDDAVREHAVQAAPLVHASDVARGGAGGRRRAQLPRRAAVIAAAISTVNVALALVARSRGRHR